MSLRHPKLNNITENTESHKRFYKKAIQKYGVADVRSLHWNSLQSQVARFNSLLRTGDFNNASVLDLGCGRGDFYAFLIMHGYKPNLFLGVDFLKEFIEYAKKKYQGATFVQKDFFSLDLKEYKTDYIICNGALNTKQENNLLFLKDFILYFLPFTMKGLGFTLLKEAPGYHRDPFIYTYKVEEVREVIKEITHDFTIYNDYADNDFTVVIRI